MFLFLQKGNIVDKLRYIERCSMHLIWWLLSCPFPLDKATLCSCLKSSSYWFQESFCAFATASSICLAIHSATYPLLVCSGTAMGHCSGHWSTSPTHIVHISQEAINTQQILKLSVKRNVAVEQRKKWRFLIKFL